MATVSEKGIEMTVAYGAFDGEPQKRSRREQLESLPVVGRGLAKVHDATEGLRPDEDDNRGQRIAKRTAQGAIIVGAAAVTGVAIL